MSSYDEEVATVLKKTFEGLQKRLASLHIKYEKKAVKDAKVALKEASDTKDVKPSKNDKKRPRKAETKAKKPVKSSSSESGSSE